MFGSLIILVTNMSINPIDKYVGLKLKMRRSFLGISQHKIGEITGVTFQQIQKYEKGTNRIGSSRLYEFSKILMVPINYFFDGYDGNNSVATSILNDNEVPLIDTGSNIDEKEILALVKYFTRIKDKNTRKSVLNLARSLSKENQEKETQED